MLFGATVNDGMSFAGETDRTLHACAVLLRAANWPGRAAPTSPFPWCPVSRTRRRSSSERKTRRYGILPAKISMSMSMSKHHTTSSAWSRSRAWMLTQSPNPTLSPQGPDRVSYSSVYLTPWPSDHPSRAVVLATGAPCRCIWSAAKKPAHLWRDAL